MKKSKILSAVLCLLMAVMMVLSVSCKKAKKPQPQKPQGTGYSEELPEKNYDGKAYRVHMEKHRNYEFYTEEDSTDPLISALWVRNNTVQDQFNVVVTPVYSVATGSVLTKHADEIMDLWIAEGVGEGTFDVTSTMVNISGNLAISGVLEDWNAQAYTQLDAPWWINGASRNFEIYGKVYNAVGKTNISALRYTYGMMYNKTIGDGLGITQQIMDAVDGGEWDMDLFTSLIKDVYMDNAEPTGASLGDRFGFAGETLTSLDAWYQSFGFKALTADETNGIEFTFDDDERIYNACDELTTLYGDDNRDAMVFDTQQTAEQAGAIFNSGNALFTPMRLETVVYGLDIMEDSYLILPFPKLDDDQDEYNSGMMDNYTVLGIYTYADDFEFVSIITEAMNIQAEKTLYPAWYQGALKEAYVSNPYSIEMVDILLDGRNFDMGTLFQDNCGRISMWFRDCIRAGQGGSGLTQVVDASKEGVEIAVQEIINTYKGEDNS